MVHDYLKPVQSSSPSSAADRFPTADVLIFPPPPGVSETWPKTDHSTLEQLRNGSAAEQEIALRQLYFAYFKPLYHYIRRHWPQLSATDVEDLTAEFLTLCLTGDKAHFVTYNPERFGATARLRTYLRAILENFLRNHHRSNQAQVRGGDRQFECLDTIRPASHQETPTDGAAAAAGVDTETYDRYWAQHILNVSFHSLENGTPATREWLPILRPWILADPGDASLKEIATEKGCTHNAVRAQLHRLRKAWRQAVRQAVAQTVAAPDDVDDELRHLATVLSRHPVE
jgi:RNA polymerase sigma-70 factor (ECF subfamily)